MITFFPFTIYKPRVGVATCNVSARSIHSIIISVILHISYNQVILGTYHHMEHFFVFVCCFLIIIS